MDPLEQQDNSASPESSLREELASNLQSAIESEQEQVEQKQQEIPVEKEGRVRDEQGKFVKSEVTNKIETPEPIVQTPEQPEFKTIPRPSSWKKDYWEDWNKLSAENPKLAQYLNEREGQFASGVSTYKQEWEQAKPLIDAIAPFQPILQQNNIDPAQWISNLGNAHHKLVMGNPDEKMAMFQQLIRDYKIPAQLAIQGQDGQWQLAGQQQMPQPQFDPNMVERLVEKKLMETSTRNALQQFEAESQEKYPHYSTVKQTMAGLLQAGLADDLPSAYEAALRHPRHSDIFSQLQQQQTEKAEAERKAAQAQKVQRARANAVSTPSSIPSGVMTSSGEKGLREQLTDNLRAAVGGRV